jgi:fructose-1,6-bisphosphatase/inositol monophosphatase family enzyme
VIITEAGGGFSDFSGAAVSIGENAIASNGRLHQEVLSIIS